MKKINLSSHETVRHFVLKNKLVPGERAACHVCGDTDERSRKLRFNKGRYMFPFTGPYSVVPTGRTSKKKLL